MHGVQELVVEGLKISVQKKKIKNMYIRVTGPCGQVKITAPLSVSEAVIRKFVSSRRQWIDKQAQRLLQLPAEPLYITGEYLPLWGKSYPLEVVTGRKNAVNFAEGKVVLQVKTASAQNCEDVINEWYREILKAAIPTVLAKCERVTGVKAREWRIKNMHTRWGTCNINEKRIWINLQLVKKAPECLEYVITHELVHLLEKGHNERFKAYMNSFYPTWRRVKAELNSIST